MYSKIRRSVLGRRAFLKAAGFNAFLAALFLPRFLRAAETKQNNDYYSICASGSPLKLPGKLGDPELTLFQDPRLHPAIRSALMASSGAKPGVFPPTLTMDSSYDDCVKFVEHMHDVILNSDVEVSSIRQDNPDVVASTEIIKGDEGNDILLFVERPKIIDRVLPCVVHIHGGGMTFSSAETPETVLWRTELAKMGLLVIGVEFRSEALSSGHHPFPHGLNDCASAVRWVLENKSRLGVSSLTVAGESGGGNLAIALGIKAKLEGWVDNIDGVFAMAPMVSGVYDADVPTLSSWRENMGYQGTMPMYRAMTKVYDPTSRFKNDPRAWPFCAGKSVLKGLPPHVILNYELDLIRDDGVVFAQRLQAAGVSASSRVVNGAHHVPEIAMPDAVPEMVRESLASIASFTKGL